MQRTRRFPSKLHDERTAALLGIALGVTFGICFLTGLYSHYQQNQDDALFVIPAGPVGLYRFTQGLHVATGIATVPLLLAKLWVVLPGFYQWPPVRSIAHAVERAMLLPLVAGSLFLLFSGVGNIALWRPWRFDFTTGHYWVAWVTMGALVTHVAAKLFVVRRALRDEDPIDGSPAPTEVGVETDVVGDEGGAAVGDTRPTDREPERSEPDDERVLVGVGDGGLSRRGFLTAIGAASGVLTVATVGQTFSPLDSISVLAPRSPSVGPQGVPVNRTAAQARVTQTAVDPAYRMLVTTSTGLERSFSVDELRQLPWTVEDLPLACVEGWSSDATWGGVSIIDLAREMGLDEPSEVIVRSLQEGRRFTSSRVNRSQSRSPKSLLALDLGDEPLHIDHGFPVRLIVPNRPGVLQTKWIDRVEITA
ncbi:MAG: molybdopterin-dependent oxidoreductase [Actinomycetota bacterium]